MVDSANERIADLKRAVAAAQAAADDALREAGEAEEQLRALQGGDADKQESLR
jgi:Tfp pilus assembly protein PilX